MTRKKPNASQFKKKSTREKRKKRVNTYIKLRLRHTPMHPHQPLRNPLLLLLLLLTRHRRPPTITRMSLLVRRPPATTRMPLLMRRALTTPTSSRNLLHPIHTTHPHHHHRMLLLLCKLLLLLRVGLLTRRTALSLLSLSWPLSLLLLLLTRMPLLLLRWLMLWWMMRVRNRRHRRRLSRRPSYTFPFRRRRFISR